MKYFLIYLSALIFTTFGFSQKSNQSIVDSIAYYIQKANDDANLDLNNSLSYLNRAKQLSHDLKVDSVITRTNNQISEIYWKNGLYNQYKSINEENLLLSLRTKDSMSLAKANFNLGRYFNRTKITDSAYYYFHKSEIIYRHLSDNFNLAGCLFSIATIQKNEKDFTGSEVTSIEAISLLDNLKQTNDVKRYKSFIYNNLGIVFAFLEQFEESINYYQKALELKRNLQGDNKLTIARSINNLALAYKNLGDYDLALKNYNLILENRILVSERPDFYALVLGNYAHTLYLSESYDQLPKLYLEALKVCDSIGSKYNSIAINRRLAEFYDGIRKKDSSLYYAYRAKEISQEYGSAELLRSLLLLSKIEEDSIAVKYYNEYIILNDSLQKNERNIRNKFARIRFETKEIEQENVQIARERMWLMILAGGLLIGGILVLIILTQRAKNKKLRFIQQQQEANEEIYNLMLSQQDKIDEARTLEKGRISQELHDGVLGRLFGTRLSLDSLNMNPSPEAIKTRGKYIDELKTIEDDIRKVSHDLSSDFVSGSGFIDIIETLVETQTKAYQLEYDLKHDDHIHWDGVTNKTKIHIYRIIQETLQNIYKHAQATKVKISFELKNNVICVSITDNGSGFDVNKARKGIGIKNITSRVNEIQGELHIDSKREVGTSLTIHVPM